MTLASRFFAVAIACLVPGAALAEARGLVKSREAFASPIALRLVPVTPALSEQCTGSLSGVTTARSSSGYCAKSDGSMVLLSSDTPRVEADGLLREPAATNLALRSQELDQAPWSSGGSLAITRTANAAVAPDGTTTAERVDFQAIGAGQSSLIRQPMTFTAAAYSFGIYLKGVSGSGTIYLMAFDNTGGGTNYRGTVACAYTSTAWTRCRSENVTMLAGQFLVDIGVTSLVAQPVAAQSVYLWGAQAELGSAATSYYPTAGTQATRAADTHSISKPAIVVDASGCIGVTVKAKAVAAASRVVGFGASNGLTLATTTSATMADGTATATATLASSAVSRSVRIVSTWSGGTMTVKESGQEVASTDYDGAWLASTAYLGSDSSGTNGLNGHILNLQLGRKEGGCQ